MLLPRILLCPLLNKIYIIRINLLRLLVTTSADQTARVWRTTDFSEVQVLQHEAKRWVWDAAFSADSQYIFTGEHFAFLNILFS